MPRRSAVSFSDWLRSIAISFCISLPFAFMFGSRAGAHPLLAALIFSLPFSVMGVASEAIPLFKVRFRSYFATILLRTLLYGALVFMAFIAAISSVVWVGRGVAPWSAEGQYVLDEVISLRILGAMMPLALILVFIIASIVAVSRKLGPGVLWNWLRGYYHQPREETRIFMFLDMADSTTLAEELGHLRFSALVRDFMSDLTGPILDTRGEVSHYIGDEAVLTWQVDRGTRDANVLRCFFLMKDRIEERSDHYRKQYGLVPRFKAGAHIGPTVATEVGDVKSEIVFHGDVLNTAARIQGLCAPLASEFLISDDLRSQLPEAFALEDKGSQDLKGKAEPVQVWAVSRVPAPLRP